MGADAPREASFAFRALMNTMARPGNIEVFDGATPPVPLSVAAGTLLLTLTDTDTPLFLAGAADTQAVHDWIAFHSGAPLTGPGIKETAGFAHPDPRAMAANNAQFQFGFDFYFTAGTRVAALPRSTRIA